MPFGMVFLNNSYLYQKLSVASIPA
ncbi:protein of unknown function [Mesotoga infera]|uniref:Uncharacterized protein n=1 Tax=Mesotoga infera TaxID=1236046 RepID=A0A7Z7LDB4_9BACT|nr:protein of unknown function [Mesotoga infera]